MLGSSVTKATLCLVPRQCTAQVQGGSCLQCQCVRVGCIGRGRVQHNNTITLVAPRCHVKGMDYISYGVARAELGGAVYRYVPCGHVARDNIMW